MQNPIDSAVMAACRRVQQEKLLRPHVAIILGSGLGGLAGQVVHPCKIDYSHIPGFPVTYAAGHQGQLILGYLSGVPVVLMQGRTHRYEGRSPQEIQFPIRVLQALGAETLIATNAAGGLNPRFEVGDLMVIDSHIDLLWPRNQLLPSRLGVMQDLATTQSESAVGHSVAGFPTRQNPYSPDLIRKVKAIARQKALGLQQGCYLGTLGPTYETRSEYRFFRWAGADAVGMSTIGEVLAARDLGMRVLAFSVITNVASTDLPNATNHEDVVQQGNSAGPRLMSILSQFLDELSGQPD
jgi:purine-nucleoside phosphorylase